jgi:hypothetical protein
MILPASVVSWYAIEAAIDSGGGGFCCIIRAHCDAAKSIRSRFQPGMAAM